MTIDYTQPRAPQPPPPPPPQQPRKGWFARNWGWVIVLGCLAPLLLMGGCAAALVFTVFSAIRATDVYEEAVTRARNDPRVIEQLGAPVETGWWLSGNINVDTNSGTAEFAVPLNGSTRSGTLEVEASRDTGPWNYSILRVRVKGTDTVIDLAPPLSPSPAESTSTSPPGD